MITVSKTKKLKKERKESRWIERLLLNWQTWVGSIPVWVNPKICKKLYPYLPCLTISIKRKGVKPPPSIAELVVIRIELATLWDAAGNRHRCTTRKLKEESFKDFLHKILMLQLCAARQLQSQNLQRNLLQGYS